MALLAASDVVSCTYGRSVVQATIIDYFPLGFGFVFCLSFANDSSLHQNTMFIYVCECTCMPQHRVVVREQPAGLRSLPLSCDS